jgi:nitrite reductase/ring-hydroxylating ferredoxin subunit
MSDRSNIKWVDALATSEIPEGGVKGIKLGDLFLALYRLPDGFRATSDVCTHEFALISNGWVEDGIIECPLHGARFQIVDGRCLGPYGTDLRCFQTRVRDGRVEVALPDITTPWHPSTCKP